MISRKAMAMVLSGCLVLAACGKNDGSASSNTSSNNNSQSPAPPTTGATNNSGSLFNVPGQESLSIADVQKIISRAVGEAGAQGKPGVIAVVDRVGNVLAVYSMAGAPPTTTIRAAANPANNTDFQGAAVPATVAAIAKAVTGAYLSSGGNAFSTRTASEIVQQFFPPTLNITPGLEGGPLFGVQFSQLPCSDLSARFTAAGGAGAFIGPKRSPLGLAADPGGFPLYKNGVLVGGVGVMADGDYGLDPDVSNVDNDVDENIALAATTDYAAPTTITADKILIDGTSLRYSDATASTLKSSPASVPSFSTAANVGTLTPVTGYFAGSIIAGQIYGSEASGIRKATAAEFNNVDAFILTNGSGANRYQATGGSDGADIGATNALTAGETSAVLEEAFKIMARARAAIRQPLDSRAQVSVSVVDTRGKILGVVRAPDAPIFGIDVALQKARTAAFFSNKNAAGDLNSDPDGDVKTFIPAARTFLNDTTAFTGAVAFSSRSIGNLSRPYFPDGQFNNPNGPFSRPIAQWSPFSTGLQSALIKTNVLAHLNYVAGAAATDTAQRCTAIPDAAPGQNRLQNGIQIFSGGVPIYRGNTLVGAVGTSGDGIDQDDMTSFLGLYNGGQRVGGIGEAPTAIRSDNVIIQVQGNSVRLRYVNCPFAPFLDTSDQNVCDGK
ncbi:MAG TPA: heme-binding protein [Rhizomicrobium sp.]